MKSEAETDFHTKNQKDIDMDSGGVLRLHYSFCCHSAVGACLFHAFDVYPCGSTGFRRKGDDDVSSLGAH